jgi:hypothetical protein
LQFYQKATLYLSKTKLFEASSPLHYFEAGTKETARKTLWKGRAYNKHYLCPCSTSTLRNAPVVLLVFHHHSIISKQKQIKQHGGLWSEKNISALFPHSHCGVEEYFFPLQPMNVFIHHSISLRAIRTMPHS